MNQIYSKINKPIKAVIEVPGDKSISQRILIIASLSIGTTVIKNISESEDVQNLIKNLKSLGVKISKENNKTIIKGVGIGGFMPPKKTLYMGNSGTATRLMLGAMCNQDYKIKFIGDKSLSGRNMSKLIQPLKKMGAIINSKKNKLPITIKGFNETMPIFYNQKVPSAQIKSAILLASLNSPGLTTIIENTPTRDHTEILLKKAGAKLKIKKFNQKKSIKIIGQKELISNNIEIGGDPSAAAIIGSAALIVPKSEIKIKKVNINKTRITFFDILKKMNGNIRFINKRIVSGEKIGDVIFKTSKLKGISLGKEVVSNMIDEIPIFCILACFANGKSSFSGGSELRNKESNRINSLFKGLKQFGINVKKINDGLEINPIGIANINKDISVKSYHDHRIAMAFLIMGVISRKKVIIDDTKCINTSFPNFITLMKKLV